MLNSGANHPTGTIGFDFKEKRRKWLDEKNMKRNGFVSVKTMGRRGKCVQGTSEMGDLVKSKIKKKIRVTFCVLHSTQKLASIHGLLSQFTL